MTNTMKNVRVLAIAVAVLCAIAFMPLLSDSMQSHAAAKLKVNKTKVTVTVGQSVKVTANKKATWKSSKTTIANITAAKGKSISIQGIKAGSTTVKAKYGKKTVKIKVTVKAAPKPATPAVSKNTTVNPDGYVKENDVSVTGYYQGDATVYSLLYQESAEVAAMQMQAFKLAMIRAKEAMDNNGGDGDGLAIVTDIDSTIADDTCYIAGAVLDAVARIDLGLEPWNNDDWDGYYQAVATEADQPIPGAKEFVDYTYENGFEWYYITNRPYYELDLTVQQLYHQGFLEKAPDLNDNDIPDLVEDYAVLREDPDGEGPLKSYQDYFYYGDEKLATIDESGNWYNVYGEGTYGKVINDNEKLELQSQSFSLKDDYRVQVQGSDFDSDKAGRRANVAAKVEGRDNIVMYLGDSINDMVSDYESDVWGTHSKDFTRKQFNDTRTAKASDGYWKDHWGEDFIVLPNATYGDWYKTTWAKGNKSVPGYDKYNSKTVEGQQSFIYDQIWAHSYKNPASNPTTGPFNWYDEVDGISPTGPDIQ